MPKLYIDVKLFLNFDGKMSFFVDNIIL